MENRIILDFHLFDGEGGEGAGETASTSESMQDVTKIQLFGASSANHSSVVFHIHFALL